MGSIARVRLVYTDLRSLISQLPTGTPVYGTLLDGKDIHSVTLESRGLLVMGNEGNGISPELSGMLTHRLLIPPYPPGRDTICCAEFRRSS